jgi:hypothetical protein
MGIKIKPRLGGLLESKRFQEKALAKAAELKPATKGTLMKKGGKAKNGTSFGMLSVKAGVDKNPNPTAADRIAGAKGLAKKGKTVAKKLKSGGTVSMQLGSYKGVIGKNTKGKATKAVGLTKAKMGKSIGKCKSGC